MKSPTRKHKSCRDRKIGKASQHCGNMKNSEQFWSVDLGHSGIGDGRETETKPGLELEVGMHFVPIQRLLIYSHQYWTKYKMVMKKHKNE